MNSTKAQGAVRARRDGWTESRRRRFIESLSVGLDVRRSCADVGLSRQTAYALRRRDPDFARAWDAALQAARANAEQAFLALLPEWLLRTLSQSPDAGRLRDFAHNRVPSVPTV